MTTTREAEGQAAATYDPLRLCVFTTVALLTWLIGPAVVVAFAALGFVGYAKARRAGLTRSKCLLRDTRLVLGYLALIGLSALAGVAWQLRELLG
ncbi:MAG TPA: hypothetical protein VFR56_06495 [Actinomycetes bacterium]|nr:hypothetical protein [Actinomycetes bacterium]